MGVIQYAVEVLKVRQIVVCGHYNCNGVKIAMSSQNVGLLNKWLRNIKDVYRFHSTELEAIDDQQKRYDRLVELNVIEQANNLAQTSFIQERWAKEMGPQIHGWVYDVGTGLLKETISLHPGDPIEDIYRYEFPIEPAKS